MYKHAQVQPQALGAWQLSEDLVAFVRTLTYASFQGVEMDSPKELDSALEPWQLAHATAILEESQELESLRFVLCPKCAYCILLHAIFLASLPQPTLET
jgi:hypothetical protein